MNIICGNLLPEISDKQAVFDIQAPEIVTASFISNEKGNYAHAITTNLSLDDGSCVLTLLVKDEQLPTPQGEV